MNSKLQGTQQKSLNIFFSEHRFGEADYVTLSTVRDALQLRISEVDSEGNFKKARYYRDLLATIDQLNN